MKHAKIYVASSWKNTSHDRIVKKLQEEGHKVYNYRVQNEAFQWSSIDPNYLSWTAQQQIEVLNHPYAIKAWEKDFNAMQWADICVLLCPAGKSAHGEAGWFVGAGKILIIFLPEPNTEPELTYSLANYICKYETELIDTIFEM